MAASNQTHAAAAAGASAVAPGRTAAAAPGQAGAAALAALSGPGTPAVLGGNAAPELFLLTAERQSELASMRRKPEATDFVPVRGAEGGKATWDDAMALCTSSLQGAGKEFVYGSSAAQALGGPAAGARFFDEGSHNPSSAARDGSGLYIVQLSGSTGMIQVDNFVQFAVAPAFVVLAMFAFMVSAVWQHVGQQYKAAERIKGDLNDRSMAGADFALFFLYDVHEGFTCWHSLQDHFDAVSPVERTRRRTYRLVAYVAMNALVAVGMIVYVFKTEDHISLNTQAAFSIGALVLHLLLEGLKAVEAHNSVFTSDHMAMLVQHHDRVALRPVHYCVLLLAVVSMVLIYMQAVGPLSGQNESLQTIARVQLVLVFAVGQLCKRRQAIMLSRRLLARRGSASV